MNEGVIDCCSLLNLYAGWRDLSPLQDIGGTWYVCDAVIRETQYVRELDDAGVIKEVPVDLTTALSAGLIKQAHPESEAELEDYVSFAVDLDDGEAQALALAKNRGLILLTDDRKATKLAGISGTRTITTATVMRQWSEQAPKFAARLPEALQRITLLARFLPPANSPDYKWWVQNSG